MRIALTYNLRRSPSEAHAELDTAATIRALRELIARSGHAVTPVEVSGPLEQVIARLRALAPDLAFNIAEGLHGQFREALWPAVFEQLGLPHTGSSPSVLALCLDKALANRVVAAAGVRVPRGQRVRRLDELRDVALPAIVKPNFEGSSKGITLASVVRDRGALEPQVAACLASYPAGVLVEEYVEGADVAVGWVDGLGVLPAIRYMCERPILDREAKARGIAVAIEPLSPALRLAAERTFAALGIEGYGRADFRVTADGEPVFLDMNPLPSLDPGEHDLYAAAGTLGIAAHDLIAAITQSPRGDGDARGADHRRRRSRLRG